MIAAVTAEDEGVVYPVPFRLFDPLLGARQVRAPHDRVGRGVGGDAGGSRAPGEREQQQDLR